MTLAGLGWDAFLVWFLLSGLSCLDAVWVCLCFEAFSFFFVSLILFLVSALFRLVELFFYIWIFLVAATFELFINTFVEFWCFTVFSLVADFSIFFYVLESAFFEDTVESTFGFLVVKTNGPLTGLTTGGLFSTFAFLGLEGLYFFA